MKNHTSNAIDDLSPDIAYFLGLFWADGCISPQKDNRKMITFVSKDIELISNITTIIQYNRPPRTYKTIYKVASWCDNHMYNMFLKYGMVPRKSTTPCTPCIPDDLIPLFLLGLCDGDGSISVNTRINSWKISIGTGNKSLFDWLLNIAQKQNLITTLEKRKTSGNNWTNDFYIITFVGFMAQQFGRLIYRDIQNLQKIKPLDRKFDKFKQLEQIKFRNNPRFQPWEEDILREKNLTLEECKHLIEFNQRNCGWKRTLEGLYRKRLTL